MENQKAVLDFYGITVSIDGNQDIANRLTSDFEYFHNYKAHKSADILLTVNLLPPPFEKIPEITASMYKTDSISYDKDGIRYIDYSGKALSIYDIKNNKAEIFSSSFDLLYEIAYLFIHSRVGEMLDMKGFHRIHGCAFSFEDKTYICMLPQGGGKSTLLMDLLKNKNVQILSDDTPFVDKKGTIYPFPARIGLCPDIETEYIPDKFISIFNRRKFGQKKLISYDFFKNRVEKRHLPVTVIYGKRFFSDTPKIIKASSLYAFKELFKNCIVGLGIPQVLEYFITGGYKDFTKKFYIFFLRFYACLILLVKNKGTYCFYISNNKKLNAEEFFNFFHK
ncbi:MAG: hypothetical protein WC234_05825 [Endomicrobiaceae bacterium]